MRLQNALRCMLGLMLLFGALSSAQASELTISMPTMIDGAPGNTITVYGDLTNNTSSTLYFGNDAINLAAPSTVATASDDIILNDLFAVGPASINAGDTLTHVDLFSITLLGGAGSYAGNSFELIGGTDAAGCANGAADCATALGSANFSLAVTPVPLPGALYLLMSGIAALAMAALGRKPRDTQPAM